MKIAPELKIIESLTTKYIFQYFDETYLSPHFSARKFTLIFTDLMKLSNHTQTHQKLRKNDFSKISKNP